VPEVPEALTLLATPLDGDRGWLLASPAVGLLGERENAGAVVQGGQPIATLRILGRQLSLLLPARVSGHLVSLPGGDAFGLHRLTPVAYGTPLFHVLLVVAGEDERFQVAGKNKQETKGLALLSPQAGRFYRAPEPGSAPFLEPGETIAAGRNIGLIEIMKTFSPVKYQPGQALPAQAIATAWLVEDGAEVEEGTPLLSLRKL